MKKIKKWIEETRGLKHVGYDDLDRIAQRCLSKYRGLFPDYVCTKDGSRIVHHFNVAGSHPISLEKPHGSREFVPSRYARMALDGLDEIANYIELNAEEQIDDEHDHGDAERGKSDD